MPFLVGIIVYMLLSLFVGFIAGFAYSDYSLLRDLFIVWAKPITDSGPAWRIINLLLAIGAIVSTADIDCSCSYYDDLSPRINPNDWSISETGQCIYKRSEPTSEQPKERKIDYSLSETKEEKNKHINIFV